MDHGNDDRDKDTTSNSLCLMKHEEEHDVDAKMSDSNTVDSEGHSEAPLPVDSKCVAVTRCVAQSCDHRKVVSHIFGRNKRTTRQLPDLWIYWCRKHYQRLRYRAEEGGTWHLTQLRLVKHQLDEFETNADVSSWTIAIRKTELDALNAENRHITAGTTAMNPATPCWERFLQPYTGTDKTYADIRAVLAVVENEFNTPAFLSRGKKKKAFPAIEFLAQLLPEKKDVKQQNKASTKLSHKHQNRSIAPKPTGIKSSGNIPSFPNLSPAPSSSTKRKATANEPLTNTSTKKVKDLRDCSRAKDSEEGAGSGKRLRSTIQSPKVDKADAVNGGS